MSDPQETGQESTLQRIDSAATSQGNTVSETESEERNLPTVSSRATRSGRQYIFIDEGGDRRTANEAIRVHVMRESHRARRQLRGLRRSAHDDARDQMTIFQTTLPATTQSRTRASSASEGTGLDTEGESETTIADELAPSNARSLADLRILAAQYNSIFTPAERMTLQLCRNDTATLCAFLALVVLQNADTGTDTPQITSAELESDALAILRSRFTNPETTNHDNTCLAIALLSRLERHRNNDETASFHEAALQRMIESQGGTDALNTRNPRLAQVLLAFNLVV